MMLQMCGSTEQTILSGVICRESMASSEPCKQGVLQTGDRGDIIDQSEPGTGVCQPIASQIRV